jgi:large exoprotein involved in heme utilization and adhesion
VEVIGRSADNNFASALAALVYRGAKGAGDKLRIETGQLLVQDRAVVNTGTSGDGSAGNLHITATESVEVIGNSPNGQYPSGLFSQVERGAKGKGGNITIETRYLSVRDGAEISTGTFGRERAGNLHITATESVEVIGNLPDGQSPSGLFSQVEPRAKGAGGNIIIETRHLSVRDGAEVSASTAGKGSSGNLHITATESVEVIGRSTNGESPSDLNTEVEKGAKRAGGDLTIETGHLSVRDGAQVTASTAGKGPSGNLHITATESVAVIGRSADGQEPSGLTASTETAGDAKNLTIETGHLTVQDGAEITVSSTGSGKAGQLEVTANSVLLDEGQLIAETVSGERGNIILQVEDLLLMRNNSLISAQAFNKGNGGNIEIKPGLIVAIPTEDSDIVADAQQGNGGKIDITTQGIFGLEFRRQRTAKSEITASSQFGISGTVNITRLGVDPSQGLAALPANLVDPTNQIDQGCSASGANQESKFTVTGRGGLPQSPNEVLTPDMVQDDLGTPVPSNPPTRESVKPTPSSPPKQLIEAQGWVVDDNGVVTLLAAAPNVTPHSGALVPASCQIKGTTGKGDEGVVLNN